jgi:hypothetical protein
MHHLRLTIDYPRSQVLVEPAVDRFDPLASVSAASFERPALSDRSADWEIPLWTFPQACLAEGRLTSGQSARVLIDTGNPLGTYVSPRWARQNLPDYQPPIPWLMRRLKHHKFDIGGLRLGGQTLPDWPVKDAIPREMDRLAVVDLLMGRDLLCHYRVTIDLVGRRLRLQSVDDPVASNFEGAARRGER